MRFAAVFYMIVSFFSIAIQAVEYEDFKNSARQRSESYREKFDLLIQCNGNDGVSMEAYETPGTKATAFAEINLDDVARWEGTREEMHRFFNKVRDERFMRDDDNFRRRPTWLYPDDGCYARAEVAKQQLVRFGKVPGSKIFVFGNLVASTLNSPRGMVDWWYHVAVAYSFEGTIFVFDPSLKATEPIELADWLNAMGNPEEFRVAFCSPHTITPGDDCDRAESSSAEEALDDQMKFFSFEWARMYELGRVPRNVLGDQPPWRANRNN